MCQWMSTSTRKDLSKKTQQHEGSYVRVSMPSDVNDEKKASTRRRIKKSGAIIVAKIIRCLNLNIWVRTHNHMMFVPATEYT